MKSWDTCKNCGAERGLHHYQTDQCPVGGREAPIGRKQEWKSTIFEMEDDSADTIATQAATIARLRGLLEDAAEKISILIPAATDGLPADGDELYDRIRAELEGKAVKS